MNDSQVSDGAGVSLPLRKGRPGHPDVVAASSHVDKQLFRPKYPSFLRKWDNFPDWGGAYFAPVPGAISQALAMKWRPLAF